jgi:hypothetical protein
MGTSHGQAKNLPQWQWLLTADKRPAKADIFYYRCYSSIGGLHRDRPIDISSGVLASILSNVLGQLHGCMVIKVRAIMYFQKVVAGPQDKHKRQKA